MVVEEETPPPLPPRNPIWPWLLALLLAAAGIVAVIWALTHDSGPDTNDVPAVVGLSHQTAEARLRAAGFSTLLVREPSTDAEGVILRQAPEPGAALERGSTVGLVASAGRREVTVPKLTGLLAPAATRLVRTLGLDPNPTVVASDERAGLVLSQNPPADEKVARNTEVFFTVSRGPRLVTVPSVRGLAAAEAVAKLKAAGLVPVTREVPSAEQPGTVIAQEPPRDKKVRRGSTVRINVAAGQAPVAVPDVEGLTEARAVATLSGKGLVPVVVRVGSTEPAGTVIQQDPAAGTQAKPGTNVRIRVSQGGTGTTTIVSTVTTETTPP